MTRSVLTVRNLLVLANALAAAASAQSAGFPRSEGAADCDPPVSRVVVDARAALSWRAGGAARLAPAATRPTFGSLTVSPVQGGSAPEGDAPGGMAFTPDGAHVLIAHWESHDVIEWDAVTGAFVRAIAVSGSPLDVAVAPDGLHAVTANGFEDTASILDLVSGTESAVLPLGDQPGVVAISPDGLTAAIGNTGDGSLSVVDIASASEVRRVTGLSYSATLSVNFESGALAVRFGRFVFAGSAKLVFPDYFANQAKIITVATGAVTSLAVPVNPDGVAVSASGGTAVVCCGNADSISVIDVPSATVTKTIAIPDDVFGGAVAINPAGTKAIVAVLNACRVVNLSTNAVSASINTATVDELYTTADGLYAFCVGYNGSLVSYATESLVKNLNTVVSIGRGAVSPVGPRAAGVAAVFGEDFLIFDTNGAAGGLVHHELSGPAPEGDKSRLIALTPDGTKVAVTQIFSDTLGLHDAATGALLHQVQVGDRPAEVAFTPDGSLAVVANMDSAFASVVDVASGAVTQVPISTRAHQVEVSKEGAFAYLVTAVADGVWRIDLATKTVAGPKLASGDTGSIGFLYSQTSGLTLSHDGGTLAVCGSFNNRVTLIDTASWSVVANVVVTGFPVRAIFDATDEHVLVSCRDTDQVKVITNAGGASAVTTTYATGDQPFELALTLDSRRLFVANFGSQSVRVIRTSTGASLGTIPLADPFGGMALATDDAELYVTTGNWSVTFGPGPLFSRTSTGQFSVYDARSLALSAQADTGVTPSSLAYSFRAARACVPSTLIDGYYRVDLPARRGPRVR